MRTIINISPKYKVLNDFIKEIAEKGIPSDAKIIYEGRNRVYTINRNGYNLNIKAFRIPRFPNSFVYGHFRLSKARRSMLNAQHLLELGINTPDPVAYIECRTATKMLQTYYICLQIEAENMRNWTAKTDYIELLEAFAEEIVKIHSVGVYHKDFSPGNILYTHKNGEYKFYLIDLNRMRFDVWSHKTQMSNFSSINIESFEETERLARMYAKVANLNADKTAAEAHAQLQKYLDKKKFLRKIKNLFK